MPGARCLLQPTAPPGQAETPRRRSHWGRIRGGWGCCSTMKGLVTGVRRNRMEQRSVLAPRGAGQASPAFGPGEVASLVHRTTGVDAVGLEERATALGRRSIKRGAKLWALDLAIRCTDLTTLEGAD